MKQLKIEILQRDLKNFYIQEDDSYINSYREFVQYFKKITKIKKEHLIISSHFVYGWMPTILDLKLVNSDEVLQILNKAKTEKVLDKEDLKILRVSINNSPVGISKLLHFINPEIYPIWDSKIYKYWSGNKTTSGIQKPENYLKFRNQIIEITKHKDFPRMHEKIENQIKYKVSAVRALELLIFKSYK